MIETYQIEDVLCNNWICKGTLINDKDIPENPKAGEYYVVTGDWHSDKLNTDLKKYDEIFYTQTENGIAYYILRYEDLNYLKSASDITGNSYFPEIEISKDKGMMCFKGYITCDGDFPRVPQVGHLYKIKGDFTPTEEEKSKGLLFGPPKPWYSEILGKKVYDGEIYCFTGNNTWDIVIE